MPRRSTISREDKLRLIRAHANGDDVLRVADILGIKRCTARKNDFRAKSRNDPGELPEASRGGDNNTKVDEEIDAQQSPAWKADVKNRLSDRAVQVSFSSPPNSQTLGNWRHDLLTQIGEEAIPVITSQKCANWQTACPSFLNVLLRKTSLCKFLYFY